MNQCEMCDKFISHVEECVWKNELIDVCKKCNDSLTIGSMVQEYKWIKEVSYGANKCKEYL